MAANSPSVVAPDGPPRVTASCPLLSERLRAARTAKDLTLRELASRIGVSASLISQIETGKVQPSVNTLYALATVLELSLDDLLFPDGVASEVRDSTDSPPVVERAGRRTVTPLSERVRWERLTPRCEAGHDFIELVYEPEGQSTPPGELHRHAGREWGYVLDGTLRLELGEETYVLDSGDSITFDSGTPHRLSNAGDVTVRAVWFVLGRTDDDT